MRLAVLGTLPDALAPAVDALPEHGVELAGADRADLVLAGHWHDAASLAEHAAARPVALVREDLAIREALRDGGAEAARRVDALALPSLVTARWLAELLPAAEHLRPPLVAPEPPAAGPDGDAPLRVHAVAPLPGDLAVAPAEPHAFVDDPGDADVVLALTRAEHLPGPTLAAMARGAVPVATLPPGREEVVEHGVNGLVVAWDDERGTGRALDLLARDRDLLARLREGALRTAAGWPGPADAARALAAALERLASHDSAALAGDLAALAAVPLHDLPAQAPAPAATTTRGRPRLRRLRELAGGRR